MERSMESGEGWRGSPWRKAVYASAAALLLVPLIAMQFTKDVVWTPLDFAVFGAMLFGACGAFDFLARMTGSWAYRMAAAVAIAGAFFLVWVNLAVGIIGTEGNPANLMFAGVLAVGITGAVLSRFDSHGMARALVWTALAQASVGAIALVARLEEARILLGLTAFFVALWLVSAGLFRRAARAQQAA